MHNTHYIINIMSISCSKKFKITTLGGGTGHVRLLEALKYIENIFLTAIVAMTDNGGSSGRLRNEFGIFPPGDLRNCIAAFIENPILKKVFQHRFADNGKRPEVSGHVFGNIFITALENVFNENSIEALEWLHNFFGIKKHRALPVTLDKAHISAVYANGEEVIGEDIIGKIRTTKPIPIKQISIIPSDASICKESEESLREADVIIFAPGSVYTSTAAVLLPIGVRESLGKSSAKKILICNVMTQPGETSGLGLDGSLIIFTIADLVATIENYAGIHFDYIICNNKKPLENVLEAYETVGSYFIDCNLQKNKDRRIIAEDLISEKSEQVQLARHDSVKLKNCLVKCLSKL